MIRKNFIIRMSFALLLTTAVLLVLAAGSGEAEGKIITVDDSGGADYEKIQDAITNAVNGDTIRVYEGTYYENVEVDKTMSLVGNGSANTTVDARGEGSPITITASEVTVTGFEVTGSEHTGMTINSNRNTIFKNTCLNNDGFGIGIYGEENRIFNNSFSSNSIHGVYLRTSNNLLANNTCSFNSMIGISIYACSYNTLENNTCTNNRDGISLSSTSRNTFLNNNCSNNGYAGIYTQLRTENNSFISNNCSANSFFGIYLRSSNNSVIGNYLRGNNNDGILVSGCRDNKITNNTIVANRRGIRLGSSSQNNTAHYNIIYGNSDYGIDASDNDGHIINASYNWWKARSGPYHPSNNSNGEGDEVTDFVEFGPWLGAPYDDTRPQAFMTRISPRPATEDDTISFRANGTTPRDEIVRYVWHSDLDGELYNDTGQAFSSSGLSTGTHIISLKVQNSTGVWSNELFTFLTVTGTPVAYIDSVSPSPALEGKKVSFEGHGTDDGTIEEYSWRSDIDGKIGSAASFDTTTLSIGEHNIFLKVRDDDGIWSEEVSVELSVRERPEAFIDFVSPGLALDTDMISFEGHGTTARDEIVRYVWRSDVDGVLYNDSENSFQADNLSVATHQISLQVENSTGVWSVANSTTIIVTEKPLVAIDSISPNPAQGGRKVSFEGLGTDDGTIERYVWTSSIDGELHNGTGANFETTELSLGDHTISFRARDDHGIWSDLLLTELTVVTEKPLAYIDSVSPNPALHVDDVLFDGHGTDDGSIEGYLWRIMNKGGEEVHNDTRNSFKLSDLAIGNYTIYFKLHDNYGVWSDEVSTTLTVTLKPTVVIDSVLPYPASVGELVTFEGNATDDGRIELYVWRSNLDGEFYRGTEETVQYAALSVGWHIIYLKVLDDSGAWSDEAAAALTIKPVAYIDSISPSPAFVGERIEFKGSGTDEPSITEYVWRSSLDGDLSTESIFNRTDLSHGTHEITLKLKGNDGVWSYETSEVFIVHEKPVASIDGITSNPVAEGLAAHFSGHGVDDGEIVGYSWSSDLDGEFGTSDSFDVSSLSVGTHEISFKVQDDNSAWSEEVSENLVVHERPVAHIDSISPEPAVLGEQVAFTGHGTDDGAVAGYLWRSSIDGELGTSDSFDTSTLSTGTHEIFFKVKDNHGAWSDEVTMTLLIHTRPAAIITSLSPEKPSEGDEIQFTGSGVDDGTIVRYVWRSDVDGELYNGTEVVFTYPDLTTGTHIITLIVQDDLGVWSNEAQMKLEVKEGEDDGPGFELVCLVIVMCGVGGWLTRKRR